MILLGVDPHKSTHTATAVEPVSNQQVGSMRIEASLADYRRLLAWAKRWPQRKWAVENANGLGRQPRGLPQHPIFGLHPSIRPRPPASPP
ncbi:IS110 family transposase (plasmid) [Streptomyces sp. NBC_00841]|nr:hypothetical protein [Streptomyces sp. NBC_00841]WSA05993.1 IS110 family transposase [Streptomyces sp. NBC_00841]